MADRHSDDFLSAVTRAAAAAEAATGKRLARPIPVYDISLILKYFLIARLERECPDLNPSAIEAKTGEGFETVQSLTRHLWREDIGELLNIVQKEICPSLTGDVREYIQTDEFRQRIALLVWEQLIGKRAAPELRICPGTFADKERDSLLGDRPVVLIAFESFPNVTNECFPLMIDSLVYNLENLGSLRWQVGLAHVSWLDARCRPNRLIFYDSASHRLIEANLEPPPLVQATLVLCASQQTHRKISFLASDNEILELNPYVRTAEWADSKIVSYDLWQEHSVPTPRSALILQGSTPEEIASRLQRFCSSSKEPIGESMFYSFQPNSGTEGHGVDKWVLRIGEEANWSSIANRVKLLADEDDVLIREVVGNVRFHPPESVNGRSCDLRINVSFDGEAYRAESGYLQVAGDEDEWVSSTSRGGLICKFSRGALAKLRGPGEAPVPIDLKTVEHLSDVAISAAKAFPGLGLVGVDLKLEVTSRGRLRAHVLDANPRPAGLTHSEFLPGGTGAVEPGVTRHLWRRISSV